ncbi:hypothetical protein BDV97DRAFT_416227 [Delphinella strobiligena]|nr:hypothetical protein BDV97DRAFT_416227 [Delphinella strobiligena]
MATTTNKRALTSLAKELQFKIMDSVQALPIGSFDALLNLSSTCSLYRIILAPFLFETITLQNTEKSGASIAAVAKRGLSHHVKVLHYIASAPGTAEEAPPEGNVDKALEEELEEEETLDEDIPKDFTNLLPPIVHSTLANLQCFPNLQNLIVEFEFDFDDVDKWDQIEELFWRAESPEEVDLAETQEAWRAIMAKSWTAISKNTSPHFKSLEIRQMMPRIVSTYLSQEFHTFLNVMEHCSISMLNQEDYASVLHLGIVTFHASLAELVYDHLKNILDFELTSAKDSVIGLTNCVRNLEMPLKSHHMPLLQTVCLERISICPDLADFLVSRLGTLQTITLRNCIGSGLQVREFSWGLLFQRLANASPQHLRRLTIEPDKKRIASDDDSLAHSVEIEDVVLAIEYALAAVPGRRVFSYRYIDDGEGRAGDDLESTREAFLRGDDQREYDRLMQIVETNAA